MGWAQRSFRWIADIGETGTAGGRALLEERYRALQRQIPLLYTVALTNFLGLHVATGGDLSSLYGLALGLVAVVLFRLGHWMKVRNLTIAPDAILRELRKTWFYALGVSIGFAVWAIHLLGSGSADQQNHVILFGSLAAVGCSYGLSSFPAAARLPLLFLGLPLAATLIVSRDAAHVGMGISLGLVILLILRLLGIHNQGFAQLVESRSQIDLERERARRAEKLAKAEKARAKRVAETDALTGLANRRAFLRHLNRGVTALGRGRGAIGLALVDLDGFKPINDTFGHAAGDEVLIDVAARLRAAVPASAVVARTGGDEFAILVENCPTPAVAEAIGHAICSAIDEPFRVGGRVFRVSACCGLAIVDSAACGATETLIRADTALYRAKRRGRSAVAVFTQEMDAIHRRRSHIEQAMRSRDSMRDLDLVYQPIRDLKTGELRAFEALARWQHPTLGPISPGEFIPIAEQINVIGELSERLLRKAAREARLWPDAVKLSFNVSAVQLCTAGSARRLVKIVADEGLDPARLQIEVTETALLADFAAARENLAKLRGAGARIVLDDFGAGHASISYLHEMRFDAVKLDGSLLASLSTSIDGRRLLKGVLDLCASMGLPCVAEHIETEQQLALLRTMGCRDGQGFLVGVPIAAGDAAALAGSAVLPLTVRNAA